MKTARPQPIDLAPAEHYFATVKAEASDSTRTLGPPPLAPFPAPPLAPPAPRRRPNQAQVDGVWHRLVSKQVADRSSLRLLPPLVETEPRAKRLLFLLLAGCIAIGFLWMNLCFWAPAHPGVDQNGYLVGGRMLADHGSTGYRPAEPYAFVGAMWVGVRLDTPAPEFFPKYPIGLPALYAGCLKLGPYYAMARPRLLALPILRSIPFYLGRPDGTTLAYLVSPICMTLSIWAMFLLGRSVAGSFAGVMAMILLATSQITLALANNPNSHASALCCVTWGMYFIIRWWQSGWLWRGLLGGFLLGYAVTIRYTEGLLALGIAVAVLSSIRWTRPRTWLPCVAVAVAWALPVAVLVLFNLHYMGTITGYDPTNESEGFTLKEFDGKWEFMAQQIYDHGVFFIAPLAVLGMALMYRASWRLALLLTVWFVPGVALYTAYYWGGHIAGVGYLRFFLTLFPAIILAAVWLIHTAAHGAKPDMTGSIATPIAAGLIVAIAAAIGLRVALPGMERDAAANLNLAYSGDRILSKIETGHGRPLVFTDQRSNWYQLADYLQFVGDVELYAADAFRPPSTGTANVDQPNPLQPARQRYLFSVFRGKADAQLLKEQHRVVQSALDAGRPVYAILQPNWLPVFTKRYMIDGYEATVIDKWKEPAPVPPERSTGPLGPAARGFFFNPSRAPQSYQLLRISYRPPTTEPSGGRFASGY